MDWPTLAILIVTYNRKDVLHETLRRLMEHTYYVGPVHYIVADDGSDDGTQAMLAESYPQVQLVQSQRSKMGANSNAGLRAAFEHTDYVMQLQDDMHLLTTLDMHPHIELLANDPTCGYIRLWGVGGHFLTANLEGNYWRVWWHSNDLYVASDRPHVKHRRFHDHFGWYPEGLTTAETEESWCHQTKSIAGQNGVQLDVFIPLNWMTETSWEHVGWDCRWRDVGL